MIVVGSTTALRSRELAGVRMRGVDFLRREPVIGGAVEVCDRRVRVGPAEEHSIFAEDPAAAVVVDAISQELAENPCDDRAMPIFAEGRMWHSGTVAYAFRGLRARCDMPEEVSWHSLRHFYASTLIQSGASVKAVQERLRGFDADDDAGDVHAHVAR